MDSQKGFWYELQNIRPALNKVNYIDMKLRIRLAESLIFISFLIALLPVSVLQMFSFGWENLAVFHRFRADVAYLELNNPSFARAYTGGIALQFSLCGLAVFLRLFFSSRSRKIHYISGSFLINVAILFLLIIFTFCFSWIFLNMSAFGVDGVHSWFESRPGGSLKGMPFPDNNFVFIFTAFYFPLFFAPILFVGLISIEYCLGRKITMQELQQGI